jgi:hypothetical protein
MDETLVHMHEGFVGYPRLSGSRDSRVHLQIKEWDREA